MVGVSDADEGGQQRRSCVLSEFSSNYESIVAAPTADSGSPRHSNANATVRQTAGAGTGGTSGAGAGAGAHFRLEPLSRAARAPIYRVLTTAALDREARASHRLRLTCTDDGTPQLTSETEFDVIVKDWNDNPPHWSRKEFVFSVRENNAVGASVGELELVDEDSEPSATDVLRLVPLTEPDKGSGLVLDRGAGGVLRLLANRSFDRELTPVYRMLALVDDPDVAYSTATATIVFNIDDENDNGPAFEREHYEFVVAEGSFGLSGSGSKTLVGSQELSPLKVGQVRARDPDAPENAYIEYEMVRERENERVLVGRGAALEHALSVDRLTGELFLRRPLPIVPGGGGQSSIPEAGLRVRVRARNPNFNANANARFSEASVVVLFADATQPRFIFPSATNDTLVLTRAPAPGSVIGAVHAILPERRPLLYSLLPSASGDDRYFRLDPNSGELVLESSLPLEQKQLFLLSVCAETATHYEALARPIEHVLIVRFDLEEHFRESSFASTRNRSQNAAVGTALRWPLTSLNPSNSSSWLTDEAGQIALLVGALVMIVVSAVSIVALMLVLHHFQRKQRAELATLRRRAHTQSAHTPAFDAADVSKRQQIPPPAGELTVTGNPCDCDNVQLEEALLSDSVDISQCLYFNKEEAQLQRFRSSVANKMVSAAVGGGGAGIRQSRVGFLGELDAAPGTGVGLSRALASPLLSPLSLTLPPPLPLAIIVASARTRSSFGGGGGGASVSAYSASGCSTYSPSKRSLPPPPPIRQTSHVSSNPSQCQSYQSQQSASGNEFPCTGGSNSRPPQQVLYRRTSAEPAGGTENVQQQFVSDLQSDRIAPLRSFVPRAPRAAVSLLRRLPNARRQHSSSSSERDCEFCESSANPECAHYRSNDLSFDVYGSLRRQEEQQHNQQLQTMARESDFMPSGAGAHSLSHTWDSDPRNPYSWPSSPKAAARAAVVSFAGVPHEDTSAAEEELEEEGDDVVPCRPVPPRAKPLSTRGSDVCHAGSTWAASRPPNPNATESGDLGSSALRRAGVPVRRPLPVYPRPHFDSTGTGAAAVTLRTRTSREAELAQTQLQNALLSPRHLQLLRVATPTHTEPNARDSIACSNEYYLLEPQHSQDIASQVPSVANKTDGYRRASGQESGPSGISFRHAKLLRGNSGEERSRAMHASQKSVSYV